MIICGRNAVTEALRANKAVFKLYVSKNLTEKDNEILRLAKKANTKIECWDKQKLDKLCSGLHHQGFVAEVEDFRYCTVQDIIDDADKKGEPPFVVILDGVEDPHNLGSVIRVCECAGVHGIIIPKHRACNVNETVSKTSAGAIAHTKIAKVTNLNHEIEFLKQKGLWVFAVELGGTNIYQQNLKGPLALVIGSEGYGTSALVKKNCDGILTLPMFGKVNSLNASVACGIAVFEAIRQRSEASK